MHGLSGLTRLLVFLQFGAPRLILRGVKSVSQLPISSVFVCSLQGIPHERFHGESVGPGTESHRAVTVSIQYRRERAGPNVEGNWRNAPGTGRASGTGRPVKFAPSPRLNPIPTSWQLWPDAALPTAPLGKPAFVPSLLLLCVSGGRELAACYSLTSNTSTDENEWSSPHH